MSHEANYKVTQASERVTKISEECMHYNLCIYLSCLSNNMILLNLDKN